MCSSDLGDPLLTQIRVAETQPDVTRVVLDLAKTASVNTSQLSNPNRLMIELRAKDHPLPPSAPSVTGGKELVAPAERAAPASVATAHEPPSPAAPAAFAVAAKTAPAPALATIPPPASTLSVEAPVRKDSEAAPNETTRKDVTPRDTTPVAAAARRADRSLTRALGLKLGRVVLDAGHGGNDVGTHGPSGYLEKDLTLDVTRRLGALIEERMGSEVVYTRSDDKIGRAHV